MVGRYDNISWFTSCYRSCIGNGKKCGGVITFPRGQYLCLYTLCRTRRPLLEDLACRKRKDRSSGVNNYDYSTFQHQSDNSASRMGPNRLNFSLRLAEVLG